MTWKGAGVSTEGPLPPGWPTFFGIPAGAVQRLAPGIDWWVIDRTRSTAEHPPFLLAQGWQGAGASFSPGIAGAAAELAAMARAAGQPLVLILAGPGLVAGETDTGLEAIRMVRQSLSDGVLLAVTVGPVTGPMAWLALDASWWITAPAPAGAHLFGPEWIDWSVSAAARAEDSAADYVTGSVAAALALAGTIAAAIGGDDRAGGAMPVTDMADGLPVPGDDGRPGDLALLARAIADGGATIGLTAGSDGCLSLQFLRLGGRRTLMLAGNGLVEGGALGPQDCHLAARALRLARQARLPIIWLNDGPGFLPSLRGQELLRASGGLADAAKGASLLLVDLAPTPTALAAALPSALVCRPSPTRLTPQHLREDLSALVGELKGSGEPDAG